MSGFVTSCKSRSGGEQENIVTKDNTDKYRLTEICIGRFLAILLASSHLFVLCLVPLYTFVVRADDIDLVPKMSARTTTHG